MLRRVGIENFRCFSNVNVLLRPLTALIGPNDTGKSAFLAALRYLAAGTNFQPSDYWRRDPTSEVNLSFDSAEGTAAYSSKSGRQNESVIGAVSPFGFFHLSSRGIPMESPGTLEADGVPRLGSDGSGVSALLDYLLREDRDRFFAIVEATRQLVPGLEDLAIATPQPQSRRVNLIVEKGLRVPADTTSSRPGKPETRTPSAWSRRLMQIRVPKEPSLIS